MFTCDLYAGSPPPHDLERLRTTMQRRVVDFVRVGYFIPLNGPLNGHPPSSYCIRHVCFSNYKRNIKFVAVSAILQMFRMGSNNRNYHLYLDRCDMVIDSKNIDSDWIVISY